MEYKAFKIGIFGGSFNPPHKMHEKIAKYLIDKKYLDKLIFVPTGDKYKYKNNLILARHRYNMLKLITDKDKNLEVSNYELKKKVIYTYETLTYFQNKYKDREIYFICGLDNLSFIDTWKNAKYILENFKVLVIRRRGDNLSNILDKLKDYADNIIVIDLKEENISSTKIRNNIKIFSNLLDEDVLKYIEKNNLYKEQ